MGAVIQEAGRPAGQDPGLAAARPGQDDERAGRGGHSPFLLRVGLESGQGIGGHPGEEG